MRQCFFSLAALAVVLSASLVHANCGCTTPVVAAAPTSVAGYASVTYETPVSYTTSYAPAAYATYYAPPATYLAPAAYTSYYVPATTSYTTYYAPATPYVTYYAAPYATYYSPTVTVAPLTYRTYYYGRPGVSMYGAPRYYVPGEPVRNTLKAVTP